MEQTTNKILIALEDCGDMRESLEAARQVRAEFVAGLEEARGARGAAELAVSAVARDLREDLWEATQKIGVELRAGLMEVQEAARVHVGCLRDQLVAEVQSSREEQEFSGTCLAPECRGSSSGLAAEVGQAEPCLDRALARSSPAGDGAGLLEERLQPLEEELQVVSAGLDGALARLAELEGRLGGAQDAGPPRNGLLSPEPPLDMSSCELAVSTATIQEVAHESGCADLQHLENRLDDVEHGLLGLPAAVETLRAEFGKFRTGVEEDGARIVGLEALLAQLREQATGAAEGYLRLECRQGMQADELAGLRRSVAGLTDDVLKAQGGADAAYAAAAWRPDWLTSMEAQQRQLAQRLAERQGEASTQLEELRADVCEEMRAMSERYQDFVEEARWQGRAEGARPARPRRRVGAHRGP